MKTDKRSKKNRKKSGEGKGNQRKRTKIITNSKGQCNLKTETNFLKGTKIVEKEIKSTSGKQKRIKKMFKRLEKRKRKQNEDRKIRKS